MKVFPTPLIDSYSNRVSTITSCVKIVRLDGITYRFTNLDKNLIIDGETYLSSYSFNPTAYSSALGLQIENMEIEGAVGSLGIFNLDIIKNLFYGAEVWLFSVDYKNIDGGKDKIIYGTVGEIEVTDKTFKLEVRGMSKRYENLYASYYGKICRARLGDSRCGVDLGLYKLTGKVDSANPKATATGLYFRFDLTAIANTTDLNLYEIYLYDMHDTPITIKSIEFFDSDPYSGDLNNIIDNDVGTYATFKVGEHPIIIIKCEEISSVAKIVVVDSYGLYTWLSELKIYRSLNKYVWEEIINTPIGVYRNPTSLNTITLNLSAILTEDSTNRYRFISNDIKLAGKESNYYQYGNVKWLTGLNAGLQTEVLYSDISGNIELALPTSYDIHYGDTFEITAGCNHLLMGSDGSTTTGHCKTKFNNVLNFRGEPYLPNEDVLLSGYIAIKEAREETEGETGIMLEPVEPTP